ATMQPGRVASSGLRARRPRGKRDGPSKRKGCQASRALLAAKEPATQRATISLPGHPWSGRGHRAPKTPGDAHPNTWKAARRICHPYSCWQILRVVMLARGGNAPGEATTLL